MRREDALRILREHRAELAALKVASLRLFGSVARDEARPDSDVDLLVTFSQPIDLFDLADVKLLLEKLLGREVDLVLERSVRPQLRERIFAEAIPAE
ncbi:MAG TPA: nucleotidyltransferase family protein [Dehalococcoidia bacterium]|nr:nucleotidyltransferase family protein [Dehalococcoidia bacterium]